MDQRRNEQDQDRQKRQASEPSDKEAAIGGVTDLPEREPSPTEQEAVKGGPIRGH